MINIIVKQCSRIFSTTCTYLHLHLWTEILAVEGLGLQTKYWLTTPSRISEYFLMEISMFLHSTTQKPKSLQYKEPIKRVHRFQHPRNLQLPTLPTLQDCSSWCWWPARPSHTEERTDYWRELFRSTFTNSITNCTYSVHIGRRYTSHHVPYCSCITI